MARFFKKRRSFGGRRKFGRRKFRKGRGGSKHKLHRLIAYYRRKAKFARSKKLKSYYYRKIKRLRRSSGGRFRR